MTFGGPEGRLEGCNEDDVASLGRIGYIFVAGPYSLISRTRKNSEVLRQGGFLPVGGRTSSERPPTFGALPR